ncbi:MAG: HEAT repeat domain-containing protein [Candidatus Eisenbacteria bacterium]|nr:HEAT repeat domain-containing protein [Candidatus Eisenbacteria bacterium]
MRRLVFVLLALLLAAPAFAETPEEEATHYLQTMVASVREKNDPMRNRMFIKLRVLGEASVDPLLAGLADETPDVRRYLAFTLGFFDVPRVTDPLLALFRSDREVSVRTAAAEALGRLQRPEAVDPLVAALADANASIRQSAAYSLGLIGDPRARPALERAKSDTDELVRFFAEEALVEIEREEARKKR